MELRQPIVLLILFPSHDLPKLDEKVQNAIIVAISRKKQKRNEDFGP